MSSKSVQWEPSSCGRTDGHDEANSRFSQFYERAWKRVEKEDNSRRNEQKVHLTSDTVYIPVLEKTPAFRTQLVLFRGKWVVTRRDGPDRQDWMDGWKGENKQRNEQLWFLVLGFSALFTGLVSRRRFGSRFPSSLVMSQNVQTHVQWRWDSHRLPKRRLKTHIAHRAKKTPKTKNQYSLHCECLKSRNGQL
jgi:hypothetical protein